ncbi:hypothetical protein FBU31_000806 [Coemansia sp. 'formosensis']|nr:hypothetical protein FBU31_000806 [Coemansia sp. 'formosensis']
MFHQPQVYQPTAATVSSAGRHMYTESGLCAPTDIRHFRPAALAIPSSVHEQSTACYSPALCATSDGTLESPTLSYSSSLSKTASPVPTKGVVQRRRQRGARSLYSAEEKEMRRKISHSAIEKRRRERTNNVLKDLQVMVPWLSKSSKVQKLEILEAAAQYIKDLRTGTVVDRSPIASVSSLMDDDEEDDEPLTPPSTSPRAMKVNFLLS